MSEPFSQVSALLPRRLRAAKISRDPPAPAASDPAPPPVAEPAAPPLADVHPLVALGVLRAPLAAGFSGMFSFALHLIMLTALGLATYREAPHAPPQTYVVRLPGAVEEVFEQLEAQPFQTQVAVAPTTMGTAFGDSHLDLGAPSISVDFEEVSGNVARGLNVFGGGEMRDPWQVVAGSEAPAKEKQIHPADAQLSAKFFDSEAYGLDFVFIVDNSGSMSGQPLAHAKEELFAAVSRLDPKQNFYVFFFNSHCIPMFHGLGAEAAKQCVPANKTNIQLLHRWLKFMPAGGGTDPSEAVALSLAMRPDAIFLLTDGAFNDAHRTEQVLIEHNLIRPAVDGRKAHVPIHTIGFYNWAAEPELAAIAKECGGTYRFIPRPVLPLLPLVPRR